MLLLWKVLYTIAAVFRDLGEITDHDANCHTHSSIITDIFKTYDVNNDGKVDFNEFVHGTIRYICTHQHLINAQTAGTPRRGAAYSVFSGDDIEMSRSNGSQADDNESVGTVTTEVDEEEEAIPEDLVSLSPEEQQSHIKFRSFGMLLVGTLICFVVSDPIVDVFSESARRLNINPFYVTFLLAPMASNATELIAAYNYAQKKTVKSITISLSTLLGAAVLNNTFSLGIFLFLIWYQKILSNYFAEFASILLVQGCVYLMCQKKVHTLFDGYMILSLYPISILFVALLESYGWN